MMNPDIRTVKCNHCGEESEIKTYQNINVHDNPELKESVKNGSIFVWTCRKCGQPNLAIDQTLYHDPDEKIMIWLMPTSLNEAEKALIEKHMDAIAGQFAKGGDNALSDYTLRRVRLAGELIEKVNIFDAGLDDVAIEMSKYITKMELAEKENDSSKAKAIMDAPFKYYKIDGADNDITFTYPFDGQIQGVKVGFNVYEDCRGIVKRNPDVRPAPGFSIVDSAWLSTKIR